MLRRVSATVFPCCLLVVVLSVVGLVGAAAAQEVALGARGPRFLYLASDGAAPVEIDATSDQLLRREVSLALDAPTVGRLLAAIERQTGLRFFYGRDVLDPDQPVTLRAESITVGAALLGILLDANVDVMLSKGRRVALVRRVVATGAAVDTTGGIVGTVTDSANNRPLADVTVLVEGTPLRATTGGDGRYRLQNVPAGRRTVLVRRVGHAPRRAEVTVVAGQELTLDVALAARVTVLDEIVTVTPGGMQSQVKGLPTPISVITAIDIERQRPNTTPEAVRRAVPTAVAWNHPAGPFLTALSVRGASTLAPGQGQMKVFVDGIEAANTSFSAVDPSAIVRIEVIRGPQAAAIYGSDAMGGVIQIFTKRGDPTLTRPQVSAQASIARLETPYRGYRGVPRGEYQVAIRGGGSGMGYHLGAGYSHTADYIPGGELSAQSHPRVHGGVYFERGILSLDVTGRYDTHNAPSVIGNPEVFETGYLPLSKPNYRPTQTQNQSVGIRLSITPWSWWRSTLTAGVDRANNDVTQTRPRLTTPADTLLAIQLTAWTKTSIAVNTSLQGTIASMVSGSLTLGFDHWSNPNTQWASLGARTITGTIQTSPGQPLVASRTITTNSGYFAQAQLGLRDALFLTAALRAETNTNYGDSLGTPLSPRVGLAYTLPLSTVDVKLRGSWGRAIRPPAPGRKQGGIGPTSVQLANNELGPERQEGWDAGVDLVFGSRGSLSVTLYDQAAEGLIQSVQLRATPVRTVQFQNVGRVKNTGVEVEGTLAVGAVELKAQYGFARARVDQLAPNYTGDLRVGDQSLLTPKHTAGGSIAARPFPLTTVSAGLTYVGSWNYYDNIAQYRCLGRTGPCRASRRDYITAYPSFVKVNASVSQQLTRLIAAFITVDNLTNNQSFEAYNDNAVIGRVSTVGVRFEY
ncbi:MAG: TonB-dependent receptor [Gemmatimonadota bacterium]